ncbi:hypothetical protein ACWGS9_08065 [Bradyrhizobium sp. Arg314]
MAGRKNADGNWDEAYDPLYFAKKHGLTVKQAKIVIHSNGPSKHACDHAARIFLAALKQCSPNREARRSHSETKVAPAPQEPDNASLIAILLAAQR